MSAAADVSVVIPVRDGARHLAEAIASALVQTSPPREILVVDDGSRDGSAEIAERAGAPGGAPLRVVRQPPLGPGAARNRGVEEACGAWIAFLDADDRWLPEKLRLQTGAARAAPDAQLVFGHVRQFFSPEFGRTDAPSPEVMPGLLPSAALVQRAAFVASGGFAAPWATAEWVEWLGRVRAAGWRSVVVPEIVAERRIHARNAAKAEEAGRLEYVRLARAALVARRARGAAP